MINDNKYIQRCFDLARLGVGTTSPNPSVGAVIVDSYGQIIGEGWTSPFGGAHAEVNAITSVKPENLSLLTTSTIFVSLEPCFHFGKTPPCVDLILKHKIPKVVIAYLDPYEKVAGKSIEELKQNGVNVTVMTSDNCKGKHATLKPFFTNISSKRPFIILKWAETADGYMGMADKHIAISNVFAKRLVHKWRSEVDAIMVGTNTTALDNPELTNRFYFGQSPIRVVLDRQQRLSKDLHIFDNTVKTIIYTEGGRGDETSTKDIIYRPINFDLHLIEQILADLYAQNIGILLVEGGSQLLHSFIEKGFWDEARIFKTATTIITESGVSAPQIPITFLERKVQLFDNQLLIFKNA